MKSVVGVYSSHEDAVQAVNDLQKAGFPTKNISIISKADIINNHVHVRTDHTVEKAEVSIGVAASTILGVLAGVGIFAIPGLGFLYGAGALVGAIAGFEFGVVGSGIVAILTAIGIDEAIARKYETHLNEGKYLIFAQGEEEDVEQAQKVLHTSGLHMELDTH
jgi:hypothetical protein